LQDKVSEVFRYETPMRPNRFNQHVKTCTNAACNAAIIHSNYPAFEGKGRTHGASLFFF